MIKSGVISTDRTKCVGCNKCIRACIVPHANRVTDERKITVDYANCILCGECLKACNHGARSYVATHGNFSASWKRELKSQ